MYKKIYSGSKEPCVSALMRKQKLISTLANNYNVNVFPSIEKIMILQTTPPVGLDFINEHIILKNKLVK